MDYVAYEGGVKDLYFDGRKETYCPHSIKWCEGNLAQIPLYLALPMDIIYFDWEKNGVPNHIGFVREHKDTSCIYTIEGNTNGGVVAEKLRAGKYVQAVFRPHYVPKGLKRSKLKIDGYFGYHSIYMLQVVLGLTPTGILTKNTIKTLQKLVKVTPDGAWGNKTSKAIQKNLLNIKADGDFGVASVKALQKWINKKYQPDTDEKKGYQGSWPELPPKTAKIAVECAYPYGTPVKKYTYKDGKPKPEYKKRLNEAWPNRSGWKYPKSRAGASCDVFVGVVLKCAGYKNAVHAMAKFVAWCRKNLDHATTLKNGDILTRSNHIMIYVSLKGKDRFANAHYNLSGGRYGAIESRKVVGGYTDIWRPKGLSYFSKGDTFTDVKKLKRFLNWYHDYNLKIDYNFDNLCEYAVKDFQTKEGLKPDGKFGEKCLKKAKEVRK